MEIMLETDVNVVSSLLEERIRTIMDKYAPMRTVQIRTKYQNWLSEETKMEMDKRDMARDLAKETDMDEHWENYRSIRNLCTRRQREDKRNYLKHIYKEIEDGKDTARLFSTTRNLLGWTKQGSPNCFNIDGKVIRKQKELADCQVFYYEENIRKIREKIPQVNTVRWRY